jgi:cytochrome P450
LDFIVDIVIFVLICRKGKTCTEEYMVELCVRLIMGAMETTPKVLALVVKRLSENPHIISELRVSMFHGHHM